MTIDQIVAEARQLSSEQVAELLDRLAAELHGGTDAKIDEAWKTETRRRIAEMESGRDPGIPGDEVMTELRRIVGQ